MKIVLTFLILLPVVTGCAVAPVGLIDASSPLQDGTGDLRSYEVLGRAEGSHGAFSLFRFIPFGRADLEIATDNAVSKLNGDALINVRYWYRSTYAFVGTYSSVEVEGDVIRFVGKGGQR